MGKSSKVGLAAVGGIVLVAFVLFFFQPQAALYDVTVDEAPPPTAALPPSSVPSEPTSDTPATSTPPTTAPVSLSGQFRGLDHSVSGTASIMDDGTGKQFLRFENFRVENGPDLRVYLSTGDPNATDDSAYGKRFVDLGKLKGNVGAQNYEIPAGTDLSEFSNATIWCKRFATGFAVAPLG